MPPQTAIRHSVKSKAQNLNTLFTHRTSCRGGWPREFGYLNPSPHSWLCGLSFLSLCTDPCSPLRFFLRGGRGGGSVHRLFVPILILFHYGPNTCSQCTKVRLKAKNLFDMWHSTFRDRRDAASRRYRDRAEITVLTSEQKPLDLLKSSFNAWGRAATERATKSWGRLVSHKWIWTIL